MESSEEQHLSEIEIFCNIINVFIIIFDQFKASLLNKSINFYNPPQSDSLPVGGALRAVDYSLWAELAVSSVTAVT